MNGLVHRSSFMLRPGSWLLVPLLLAGMTLGRAQERKAASETDARIASGIRLLQSGDAAGARSQFTTAIQADPLSADALTWRGIAENQLRQYRAGASDFEAALRIQPASLSARYNLALSLIRLGEADRAIAALEQVLRARPGAFEPEYNLALLLQEKRRIPEAIEHLEAANRSHPGDRGVLQHLSRDLVVAGRVGDAQKLLVGSPEAAPPEALQTVSDALLKAGDFKDSVPVLELLRTQRPSRETDYQLARACIGAADDTRAIRLLQPWEASDPDGEAAYLIGLAQADMGATQEAIAAFQQVLRLHPRNDRALYHLGEIESADPQTLSQATAHLEAAQRLAPGNADYALALARLLLEQNEGRKALSVLRSVAVNGQRAGERDLLLGIAQITVEGTAQAIPTLQRAIQESPSLALSYDMLGFCYFSQGQMPKAAAAYARASDLSPSTGIFARNAAIAWDHANNAPHGLPFAERAAALPRAGALDHETFGRLLAKAGRRADAIQELTRAVSLDPDLEPAYFLLGRTCMQAGDPAQAKLWFARLEQLKRQHQMVSVTPASSKAPIASSALLQGGSISAESPE
jgi:tetratricopeptide (TPR) repeat protein